MSPGSVTERLTSTPRATRRRPGRPGRRGRGRGGADRGDRDAADRSDGHGGRRAIRDGKTIMLLQHAALQGLAGPAKARRAPTLRSPLDAGPAPRDHPAQSRRREFAHAPHRLCQRRLPTRGRGEGLDLRPRLPLRRCGLRGHLGPRRQADRLRRPRRTAGTLAGRARHGHAARHRGAARDPPHPGATERGRGGAGLPAGQRAAPPTAISSTPMPRPRPPWCSSPKCWR